MVPAGIHRQMIDEGAALHLAAHGLAASFSEGEGAAVLTALMVPHQQLLWMERPMVMCRCAWHDGSNFSLHNLMAACL